MSQDKTGYSLKPLIRANKNFVYKEKKYPIDFNLITQNSNYFYSRREQYDGIQDIILSEEQIDISDDSIINFIFSCQNKIFDITDSNVFSLHQLSIKYEVPCLNSLTDEYIKKYDKSLVFRSIQYKFQLQKQNSIDSTNLKSIENDEKTIISNFFEYINDDQLLELPIPVLYRIINDPKLDMNQLNQTKQNELIDFLFKCLDKHKTEASVLFLNLDLENQRVEIFSKLVNEYSNIFDFSMINSKFLMKTTTDLLSELSQLKQNYLKSISQVDQLLKQIKIEKQNQQDLVNSFKQFAQDQLNKEHEKLNESFENLKNQINDEKNNLKNEIEKNVNEMKALVIQNINQIGSFITKDILNILFKSNFVNHLI